MMRSTSLATLSALLLVSVPVSAQTGAQPPAAGAPATAEKSAKADKKLCKFMSTVGTRLEKKICKTEAEWKKFDLHN